MKVKSTSNAIISVETAKGNEPKGMEPPADCPSRMEHLLISEELKEIMGYEVHGYDRVYNESKI